MNKVFYFKPLFLLGCLASLLFVTSCVDQDFDFPPEPVLGEAFENTVTIKDLIATYYKPNANPAQITAPAAISGIVIANDESGNYFKEIVIQDETGGIEIQLNATGLHNDFPVGRRVYVNCQNLYIGDFAGVIQLGGSYDAIEDRINRIDEVLINQIVVKGAIEGAPEPKLVTIEQLGAENISTLVRLENIQFTEEYVGGTYADYANRETVSAVNTTLEDCNGNTITLRNSSYANFAEQLIPNENGTITGIYSVFNTTKQIFIRDLSDVNFDKDRCSGGGGGGSGTEGLITIGEVRDLFKGSSTAAPANTKIKGVVISDRENANITGRNLAIQGSDNKGIILRFNDTHNFNLGDELEVVTSGIEISEFNGLLQLNNLELGSATVLNRNVEVQARTATISSIIADFENFESTLVSIADAEISKGNGTTYSGSTTVKDPTGTIAMFTTSYSTFANQNFPTGKVNITAIVSQGGNQAERQINIRQPADITGGSPGGGGTGGGGTGGGNTGDPKFSVDFQDQTDFENVKVSGWQNISLKGQDTRVWLARSFQGNLYAQATTFNDPQPEMDTWLISPKIDLAQIKTLQFRSAMAFWRHNGLTVLFSSTYDGTNVNPSDWQPIEATIAANTNAEDNQWIDSGLINLPTTSATGYIAFRCVGTSAANTTSFRVDDIVLK